jgi:hypothetical protein
MHVASFSRARHYLRLGRGSPCYQRAPTAAIPDDEARCLFLNEPGRRKGRAVAKQGSLFLIEIKVPFD